jgi:hypothetical protein
LLQGCNCEWGYPCNFNAPPSHGSCNGAWAGHIDEGNFGGTSLAELNFAIGAHWPLAIHLGNGEGFALIDERADLEQRQGLVSILTGKTGGPFGILASTMTTLHTPQYVPFNFKLYGARSSVSAGE